MTRMDIVPDDEPLVNKPSHRPGLGGVCGVQCVFGVGGSVEIKYSPTPPCRVHPLLMLLLEVTAPSNGLDQALKEI